MSRANVMPIKAQIRPSLKLDTIVILQALQKDKPLGETLEELLKSCPEFVRKKEELILFKG